jgi:hypothetical protein
MSGSIAAEDEGFYVAFTRSRFVLSPAGVELDAFRPDLVALAGCGGAGSGLPGIPLNRYRGFVVDLEPPKLDAMRPTPSGCGIPNTTTVRGSPDLAPMVVRMTAGRPSAISAKLRLPPVSLATSWSRWCAVGRKSATPTFVAAKLRIIRYNALASLKDRAGMASFLAILNAAGRYSLF